MPYLCRMNEISLLGLIWLYIFSTGLYVASLEPGYLDFDNLPDTNFSCVGKVIGGYYADLEANCQMFHVCTIGQLDEPMDIRFLCLNGTVFDQETRVCERIDEVDCSKSEKFYSLNLELYGNTQPPILEEDADTEAPPIEKSTVPTTTTTTTTTTPRPRTTTTTRPPQFFSSSIRTITPSSHHKIPPSHHFPIGEQHHSPQYTPEEINISLNPGAPPDIRTQSPKFPSRSYSDSVNSDNKKIVVTTDSSVFESANANRKPVANRLHFSSTTERNTISYNNIQTQQPQNNFNFNFNYHDIDTEDFSSPSPHNYHYQNNLANFRPPGLSGHSYSDNPFRSSTHRNEYLPITRKSFDINRPTPSARSLFLQPIKSPSHQYFTRTEKPQEDDLPAPVLPTLSPIVFSSPAPFTLSRHIETKRFTDEHESHPRIIISASASVSDASGRTLNYSLGTIGAAQLLAQPPSSYDDYKEDDVVLDPFYHDVPKIQNKQKRSKRDTKSVKEDSGKSQRIKRTPQNINPADIIKSEDEAIEVLKFLFDWYKNHEKTTKSSISIPVSPDEITSINKEFSHSVYNSGDYLDNPPLEKETTPKTGIQSSDLFNGRSKYNILGSLFGAPLSPETVIQEPVTEPYRSSITDNISGITSRPSKVYIENYESTLTRNIDEQLDRRNAVNENVYNSRVTSSNNRRKTNRGRHRFTVPYSATERHKTPSNYEETYIRETTSNPLYQHDLNGGFVYDIRDTHKSTTRRQYEQKKSWNQLYSNGKDKHERDHQDIIVSKPTTESSFGTISEETFKQTEPDEKLISLETTKLTKSDILVSTSETPHVEDYTENNDQQIQTVQSELANASAHSYFNVVSEVHKNAQTFQGAINFHNNLENLPNLQGANNEQADSDVYHHKSKNSAVLESNLEELNRAESQKTTNQLQQKSTENDGSFDVYDYVNDNYEPLTYTEQPEVVVEQQLEKGKKGIAKEIVHEETHINVDFSEASQDISSEEHTQSTSLKKSTLFESSEDNSNESSESYQETSPKEENNFNSDPVNTPTFKYLDKNINSFTDILKSLRDYQRYEQNIYDYNHNLIGYKEYRPQKEDNEEDEMLTTISPTTLESNTNKFEFFNEINKETTQQNIEDTTSTANTGSINEHQRNYIVIQHEEQYTESTRFFNSITQNQQKPIFTTQAPEDEQQLYTSRPYVDITWQNIHTSTDFNYSQTTPTPPRTSQGTTDSNLYKETIIPGESTTKENEIDEPTTDGITTFKVETDYPPTEKNNLKTRSKSKWRTRLRNREYTGHRIQNQPDSSSKFAYSGLNTDKRRKSRRRQPNTPHLLQKISTSETPISPVLTELDTISDQSTLHSVGIPGVQHNENEEFDSQKNTNFLILDINKNSVATLPLNLSIDTSNTSVIENTSMGFFITKLPKDSYTQTNDENNTIGPESVDNARDTTDTYTTYTDDKNMNEETLQTETTTTLSGDEYSTNSTPTTYVFITEENQMDGRTDENANHHDSTIETTTQTSFTESEAPSTTSTSFERLFTESEAPSTTSTSFQRLFTETEAPSTTSTSFERLFTESEAPSTTSTSFERLFTESEAPSTTSTSFERLFTETEAPSTTSTSFERLLTESEVPSTTSTSFERLFKENETSEFVTQLPTTSQYITTSTSNDLFETLFTDVETTTDVAGSTKLKYEQYTDEYPTLLDVSTTSIYDSESKLIKKIEEATNSTVVSETAQDISARDDFYVNTTQESQSEDVSKVNKRTEQPTEITDVPTTGLEVTTENLNTKYYEPSIISTYQTNYQSTTEKYEDYSSVFFTTTKPLEENTSSDLERTTLLPSTRIEVITNINIGTDTVVPTYTESMVESLHPSNKEIRTNKIKVKDSENRKEKYSNTRRTQQRLPKKKAPGFRKFSPRHRFGSHNVTPKTASARKSFQKNNENYHHRFDVHGTPTPTTERNDADILGHTVHEGVTQEDEASMTDNPLPKNVKPTRGDSPIKIDLSTTPLSTLYKVQLRKERVNKQFIFNCFGKALDAFYSDPRDCRLFHYCTKGYTRNQLLDMKFVCDFGTHFDDEKLVCTSEVPKRCL